VTAPTALDRIGALLAGVAAVQARLPVGLHHEPIAVGWATVELDRAAAELTAELDLSPDGFRAGSASPVLGARCLVAKALLPGRLTLALLEPSTEGRLAASLARFAEGPAVVWLAEPRLSAGLTGGRAPGGELPTAEVGPFGAERLILGGPRHGPYWLVLDWVGIIRS
jgi:hypothetical protein